MNQGWKNKRHTLVLALRIFAHYNKLHFATTTHTETHTLLPKTATLQIHSEKSYCFFLYSVPIVYVLRVSFNNYVDSILPFFDPPPTPVWTVFIPWAWTKTDIFWHPPPSSCPRSYWMAPYMANAYNGRVFRCESSVAMEASPSLTMEAFSISF